MSARERQRKYARNAQLMGRERLFSAYGPVPMRYLGSFQ